MTPMEGNSVTLPAHRIRTSGRTRNVTGDMFNYGGEAIGVTGVKGMARCGIVLV